MTKVSWLYRGWWCRLQHHDDTKAKYIRAFGCDIFSTIETNYWVKRTRSGTYFGHGFKMRPVILQCNQAPNSIEIMRKALTLTYSWSDDFMTWNPDMHGGIKQIVVNADNVWTPDILLINSESDGFDPKFRANVLFDYKGRALWLPPTLQTSSCEGIIQHENGVTLF